MEGMGELKDSFLSLEVAPVSGCSVATLLDLDILLEVSLVPGLGLGLGCRVMETLSV